MKRNWAIIAGIVGAIILYDIFVLRPYNRKQAEAQKAKQEELAKKNLENAPSAVDPQSQVLPANNDSTSGVTQAQAQQALSSTPPATSAIEAKEVENFVLGPKRSVALYSNGGLGTITFEDYFQRETEEKLPIKIDQRLRWTSSNPQVQNCINQLAYQGEGSFLGRSNGITCRIDYKRSQELDGKLSVELSLQGLKTYQGVVALRLEDRIGADNQFDYKKLDYKLDGEFEEIRGDDLLLEKSYRGSLDWLGWGDKYFVSVFVPRGTFNPDFLMRPVLQDGVKEEDRRFETALQYPIIETDNPDYKIEFAAYLGTRDLESMKVLKDDLIEIVDMGWFSSVGRFMLWCLEQLNRVFNNFGWSIIALTFLVRVVFWPLNKRVFESGQKMKDIQPKVEALRKKYGKDRESMAKMNQEMMALYRQEKVNPAGSCLPLLLQMPIFIGLYGALSNSIDLYQAPYMFWIDDLSSADRYYVLPVLWTLSMLAMMKYTPQPTQQQPGMPDMKKIMFVMYIVFGFMAKDWPSGLCLYLVVSSVVGTLQQMFFRRAQLKLETVQEGA